MFCCNVKELKKEGKFLFVDHEIWLYLDMQSLNWIQFFIFNLFWGLNVVFVSLVTIIQI